MFRLPGASFECADDEKLNTWHERLNVLWRNLASPQVASGTHVIRRRERVSPGARVRVSRRTSSASTGQRLAGETLMVNELYLSTVYRPTAGLATGMASQLLKRSRAADPRLSSPMRSRRARSFAKRFAPRSLAMSRRS